MTKVTYDMEKVEGYEIGVTPITIKGMANFYQQLPGTESAAELIGMGTNSIIAMTSRYEAYFDYVLNYPIVKATRDQSEAIEESEEYKAMNVYPQEGYIKFINGVLVVKMG